MMKTAKTFALFALLLGLFFLGKHFYQRPGVSVGDSAPDFKATLIDGKDFSLSSLRGNYTLLVFWGSWCGPCRRENPELVKLYKRFGSASNEKGEGFGIVSVALEQRPERAIRTIRSDGLNWPYHISQGNMFKGELARLYGIREIPAKIFLDPQGKIISVNASLNENSEKLGEIFPEF